MNELDQQIEAELIKLLKDESKQWVRIESTYAKICLPEKSIEITIIETSIFIEVGEDRIQVSTGEYKDLADVVMRKEQTLINDSKSKTKQSILNALTT